MPFTLSHGAAEISPVGKEMKPEEQVAEGSSHLSSVASEPLCCDWNSQMAWELLGELWFGAKSVVQLTSPGVWSCCSTPGNTNSTTSSTVPGKWVWALREHLLLLGL